MKTTVVMFLSVLLLGWVSHVPAREPAKGTDPNLLVVRVWAADDGSVLDVDFVNTAGGKLVQTPTGLILRHKKESAEQPDATVDWQKVVTEKLTKLRQDQNLDESTEVRVAADDHLDFGEALAAVACCRKAGFKLIDFAERAAGRVVILVDADGKYYVGGHALSLGEIKDHLSEVARYMGGPDQMEITVRAHSRAKYAVVFELLREFRDGGYRTGEVSSLDLGSTR